MRGNFLLNLQQKQQQKNLYNQTSVMSYISLFEIHSFGPQKSLLVRIFYIIVCLNLSDLMDYRFIFRSNQSSMKIK